MFFFVINWKLSPHKIDFSGLHKERRLEKFQNYRAIVLFRVRGPMGSCLCSLVSMNDISSYFISVECKGGRWKPSWFVDKVKPGKEVWNVHQDLRYWFGKCVCWWEPAVTNQGNKTHLSKWNERFLKINHESGIFCCKGAYIGWSK